MAGNAALPLFCDATGAVEEAQVGRFCELLHTRGFAIVRLPACAHAEAAAVRKAAGTFFALEKEEKRAVGDFRAIGDTYVGYRDTAATRQDCDAEFLEVRLERAPLGAAAATALAPTPASDRPPPGAPRQLWPRLPRPKRLLHRRGGAAPLRPPGGHSARAAATAGLAHRRAARRIPRAARPARHGRLCASRGLAHRHCTAPLPLPQPPAATGRAECCGSGGRGPHPRCCRCEWPAGGQAGACGGSPGTASHYIAS